MSAYNENMTDSEYVLWLRNRMITELGDLPMYAHICRLLALATTLDAHNNTDLDSTPYESNTFARGRSSGTEAVCDILEKLIDNASDPSRLGREAVFGSERLTRLYAKLQQLLLQAEVCSCTGAQNHG